MIINVHWYVNIINYEILFRQVYQFITKRTVYDGI